MKILVIGGNSYIARAFVKRYENRLHCIVLKRCDTLNDYFDLRDDSFAGYDAVLNCTAIVHQRNPDKALAEKINTHLPYYLAQLAKAAHVPLFVQLSTVAVYGNVTHIDPTTLESPDTLYGRTKFEGDRKLLSLQDDSFGVSLIRPPMVYGPDAPGNLKSLIRLIRILPVLPFDYRSNHRSLIYVENLLHAIESVMEIRMRGIVLVRDRQLPSLYELCTALLSELKLKRLLLPMPEWMISKLCRYSSLPFAKLYRSLIIDDSLTRKTIGDYASVPFSEAIRKTLSPRITNE